MNGVTTLPGEMFGRLVGRLTFLTCPEGLARKAWVRRVLDVFLTLRRAPGLRLVDLVPDPSPPLIQGLAHVAAEIEALESHRLDAEMTKAKKKSDRPAKKGART